MPHPVATRCATYSAMEPYWDLPERLYLGTLAMRQAGTMYLPRMHGEDTPPRSVNQRDPYADRLALTFLYNAFKHSINGLRGKVFSNPAQVTDDSDMFYRDLAQDIDWQGRDINGYAMEFMTDALKYGLMFTLVDFPTVDAGGRRPTLADNRAAGARPYFTSISPRQVLGWRYDYVGGKKELSQFRFCEQINEYRDDFDETAVEQIRVIYRDRVEVWRQPAPGEDHQLYSAAPMTLGYIPLVPYYTQRTDDMQAISPLFDLAMKNLEHWQHSSMQQLALHAARSLIMFGAGFDLGGVDPTTGARREIDKIQVGMHQLITAPDSGASLQYLQFPTASIDAGKQHLDDIKDEMAVLALGPLLQQRPGNITATSDAIRTAQQQSILWSWATELKAALEKSLEIAGDWMGRNDRPSVSINTDFGIPTESGPELDLLFKSVMAGKLSRDRFWSELKRRNVLSDDFDPADEAEAIDDETGSLPMSADTADMAGKLMREQFFDRLRTLDEQPEAEEA